MNSNTILIQILIIFQSYVKSANILCFFPIPAHSHQVFLQPIWKQLSLDGHNVTVYTSSPLKDPTLKNLTEIDVSPAFKTFIQEGLKKIMYQSDTPFNSFYNLYEEVIVPINKIILEYPEIINLLKDKKSSFDVVIIEPFPPTFLALGNKFDCPVIQIYTLNPYIPIHLTSGNPIHPVFYPDIPLSSIGKLNFLERLYNVFHAFKIIFYYNFNVLKRCEEYKREYFGNDLPPLTQIIKNVSLMLFSMNPVLNNVRPLIPNAIPLTMVHINKKPGKLPEDIQTFLDDAPEGVIYMSLGSNLKSAYLNPELLKTFVETFSKVPYKILWKFENQSLSGISKNVLLKKWCPQQDILGHPNVKLFIMQGGMQSLEEAIFNKVPLIVLPFISDQFFNAKKVSSLGIGEFIQHEDLTSKKLRKLISKIIQNDRYRDQITKASILSQDEKMYGVEKAIWWIEYVIRNKGANHLKPTYLDEPFYQYYLLDIIFFTISFMYFSFLIFKLLDNTKKCIFLCVLVTFISYAFM